jgi:hypothetical protein
MEACWRRRHASSQRTAVRPFGLRGLTPASASNMLSCEQQTLSKQLKSMKNLIDSNHGIYRGKAPDRGIYGRRPRRSCTGREYGRPTPRFARGHCQEKCYRSSSAEGRLAATHLAAICRREDLVCLRPERGGWKHPRGGWDFSYRRLSHPSQSILGGRPPSKDQFSTWIDDR